MNFLTRIREALKSSPRARHLVQGLFVAFLAGAVATVAGAGRSGILENFERRTLDERFKTYQVAHPVGSPIVVVEITDSDLDNFTVKRRINWPWSREAYALATDWFKAAGAKAVFFDITLEDGHGRSPEKDAKLTESMTSAGNVFLLATFDTPLQKYPERLPALMAKSAGDAPPWMQVCTTATGPLDEYIPVARGILDPMYGVKQKDADGIARRYPVGAAFQGKAFLSPGVALAAEIIGKPVTFEPRGFRIGDLFIPVDSDGDFNINWIVGPRAFNPGPFTLGGVIDNAIALKGKKTAPIPYDPAEFKDKVVYVGASAEGLCDLKVTPLGTQLGVEIHAAATDTILKWSSVQRVSRGLTALGTFGLALFAGLTAMTFRIRWSVPLAVLAGAAWTALAWRLLGHHHIWLDLIHPLGALGIAELGATLVNYAVEGRQRRDIRNKFSTYLTPEYVKLLEDDPSLFKLGGEERVGTAFFSDLSGFTAMSEKMTAGELVARMNEYLTLMTKSIKRFSGTVDKYEGDAIVAFWNAPIVQADHAVLACRAALDNQRELAGLRERWIRDYGVTVVARIGLNTGKMIFGNMGSDDKFNYTMMGDPVNLAARLESANKDYATFMMIGSETWELVKDAMECRELDLIKVKGKQIPVTVYELLCEKGALDPRTRECMDRYNLGLQAYRLKQFHAAEQRFLEALEINPNDGPSKLYVERSRSLVAKPPEPGWTYVYEKKDK